MSIFGTLVGIVFGWGAELFVEVVNKFSDKKTPLQPFETTKFKFIKEADEFVEVEKFIENLDNFQTKQIKVYTVPEGDVLEVTFKNGLRNKILTSRFSTTLENMDFASQLNSYLATHHSRIIGVKIDKLGNQNYNVVFEFEEID